MKNTNPHLTPLFGAPPSPLRTLAWAFLLSAAAILTLLLSTASSSFAGSATWKASPATGDWNTATNWTPTTVPNGASDTATFATSNITSVSLSANTEVNGIVFNSGASAFTITASPTFTLTISGVGPTNNSATSPNFVTVTDGAGNFGTIVFTNSAAANTVAGGPLITFTNNGATASGAAGGNISFRDTTTANRCIFITEGGTASNAQGGHTDFTDNSTAGNAEHHTLGGTNGGLGGWIAFGRSSSGGTAFVALFGNGYLDISGHNAPGMAIGNLRGNGAVFLGGNDLTVGTNNLSTTFSGVIQDGAGFTGGSITKVGTGKLPLTKASTYTGGTTIEAGTLLAKNKTGSGTGSGFVQINAGTFGGTGMIDGAVTVGTGSSSGAILLPGNNATPGTLTINSTLTFNSLSTYKCVLKRTTAKADKVVAVGVTINSGALFVFTDVGSGTLPPGTVFTVIDNTSANPIAGTFSNLPDNSTFTSNGNTYQASYEGGTGNDLTLTVVP